MRLFKLCIQVLFFLLVFALFVSRGASSGFSHDENQFIAAGQLLARHGLLPYVDYPFTHMPYGVAFYALSAAVSNYDFLAGRILNAIAWALSALFIVLTIRVLAPRNSDGVLSEPSFSELLTEFVLVLVFLYHPIMRHIDGPALNHSLATLLCLVAVFFSARALQHASVMRVPAFMSGVFVSLAVFVRLNFAAPALTLLLAWIVFAWAQKGHHPFRLLLRFVAGGFLAVLPGLVLAALSPAHFYYGNFAYIRLNTVYYQEMGYRLNMTLADKLQSFGGILAGSPIDIGLYAALIVFVVLALIRYGRKRSTESLLELALGGVTVALALSAFAPTPTQPQYYFAPVPFMLIVVGLLSSKLEGRYRYAPLVVSMVIAIALSFSVRIPNPISELSFLTRPAQWMPIQIHDFDETLREYVPAGKVLTLLPMLPLEAGYDVYPFSATGSFSWRTSELLTTERRAQYGITSPDELPQILANDPPAGIITRLESTNDGFVRNDLGGLETPFGDYATAHGYTPVPLQAPFLRRTVTLWVKQP